MCCCSSCCCCCIDSIICFITKHCFTVLLYLFIVVVILVVLVYSRYVLSSSVRLFFVNELAVVRRQAFYTIIGLYGEQMSSSAHNKVVARLFSELLKATIELTCRCVWVYRQKGTHGYVNIYITYR